jgi:hypothetical protein
MLRFEVKSYKLEFSKNLSNNVNVSKAQYFISIILQSPKP